MQLENSKAKSFSLIDKIVWLLTSFLFTSFYIFETYTWGRYVFLSAIVGVFVLTILKYGSKYKFCLESYQYHIIGLVIFAFSSTVWSIRPSDAIQKGITLTEILICMMVLYNYYKQIGNCVRALLSVVKWSSYIVSLYSFYFYGINYLATMVRSGIRISNEYSNINSIGMLAAVGIVIQVDEIIKEKRFYLSSIFCIPSFYILIATQSRKAFVILIAGVVLSLMFHNVDHKNALKTILRTIVIIAIAIVSFNYLIALPIFSAINSRMINLISLFTGEGDAGSSAIIRNMLAEAGIKQFFKTPILGIGIGNPHLVAASYVGFDTYLHNNFVEMLAGGGIIGFVIYYSFYYELLSKFWKLKKYDETNKTICLVLILIFLVMDFGMVSVYSKNTYFYFLIFFLELECLIENKEYGRGGIES